MESIGKAPRTDEGQEKQRDTIPEWLRTVQQEAAHIEYGKVVVVVIRGKVDRIDTNVSRRISS